MFQTQLIKSESKVTILSICFKSQILSSKMPKEARLHSIKKNLPKICFQNNNSCIQTKNTDFAI